MLNLEHVWRVYTVGEEQIEALRDVTLAIGDGEFIAIVGPSGSGKSTLLQIAGLLDRPTQGTVALDDQDVSTLDDEQRAHLRLHTIGFVFQRFHLLGDLTALENVALPMEAAGIGTRDRFARAANLLELVGLGDRLAFRPAQLSGGQRQRVAIARALANHPRIIFADEPTGELHSEDKLRVVAFLQSVHREGRTVVVVTHDAEVAAAAQRYVEIRDGRVKELVS